MTPAEQILWNELRNNRLEGIHFRRQQIIDGFIADFYCHSAGLVVEVDGAVHDIQKNYDRLRDEIISARKLTVMRVTNDDVELCLPEVLRRIFAAVKDLTPQPPSLGGKGEPGVKSPE